MLDRTIYISEHPLHITEDRRRNVFIGTITTSVKHTFYGDTINEVINQAEELVNMEEI